MNTQLRRTLPVAARARTSGFAVAIEGARRFFVRMVEDGWCWTRDEHAAHLFADERQATAWATRSIGGGTPKVVGVWRG